MIGGNRIIGEVLMLELFGDGKLEPLLYVNDVEKGAVEEYSISFVGKVLPAMAANFVGLDIVLLWRKSVVPVGLFGTEDWLLARMMEGISVAVSLSDKKSELEPESGLLLSSIPSTFLSLLLHSFFNLMIETEV